MASHRQVSLSGTTYDYPADYGLSTCKAHDNSLAPYCDDPGSAPAWCADSWCYVDRSNCVLSTKPYESSYFPPGDERNGTRLRCASVDAYVRVCLFNGPHCLPFQDKDDASGECEWIDDDPTPSLRNNTGALAFAALIATWLETHVTPPAHPGAAR